MPLLTLHISMAPYKTIYKRTVHVIFDTLGEIGGLFDIVAKIIASFVALFCSRFYMVSIAESTFPVFIKHSTDRNDINLSRQGSQHTTNISM